ncbi:hypothetical protein TNCV_4173571 [Trichonephila clavipes]|nr:hypothetical protein TNCV_4173571 [Trichonephila clavipes]
MVGAGKCGTFEGSRRCQSDVSTRGLAHPPPSSGSPQATSPPFFGMCKTPCMFQYRPEPLPVDWLKVACTHGVRSEH